MRNSDATADTSAAAPHGQPEHPAFVAHHYRNYKQQYDAGKLGMWIFLLTEILLFGGLFCTYAVYRANHPEIFVYAHRFLDKTLGATNTCILILSSFTMAWSVRCAQLGQRRRLILMLSLTLLCACGFLGIKYVEYRQKWQEGLLWASQFHPVEPAETTHRNPNPVTPKAAGPAESQGPRYAGIFFSIYFLMTGLHGLHVLGGMTAITWLVVRAAKGHFNSTYFGPVDYVGLYWHLVDLVWIYLFPLLYLIR
jgi:cytochrome c oxidase subunit 3